MIGKIMRFSDDDENGVIIGEDGLEYTFEYSEFTNIIDLAMLHENLCVQFESARFKNRLIALTITPRDVYAKSRYLIPKNVLVSHDFNVKGWETLDRSSWCVVGSSKISPQHAKEEMIKRASLIQANALVYVEFFEMTSTRLRANGTKKTYPVYHYRGWAASVGKKAESGVDKEVCLGIIDQSAIRLKRSLKSKSNLNLAIRVLMVIFLLYCAGYQTMADTALSTALPALAFFLVLFSFFILRTDQDKWLGQRQH